MYYIIRLRDIRQNIYWTRDTEIDETVLLLPHQLKTKMIDCIVLPTILLHILLVHNTSVDACFPFILFNNYLIWQFFWRLDAFDPQCQISEQMMRGFLISMAHPWCDVMMAHYPHIPLLVVCCLGPEYPFFMGTSENGCAIISVIELISA